MTTCHLHHFYNLAKVVHDAPECFPILVGAGCDVLQTDSEGHHLLASNECILGNESIFNSLIDLGLVVCPTVSPDSLLRASITAKNGNIEAAVYAIRHGANPNFKDADNYTPLSAAIKKSRSEIVRLLINFGAKVNKDDVLLSLRKLSKEDFEMIQSVSESQPSLEEIIFTAGLHRLQSWS